MSDNHGCAREQDALEWLSGFDPGDGHGLVGAQALDAGSMFTQPVVIAAFIAGAESRSQVTRIEFRRDQPGLACDIACPAEPFAIPADIAANGDLVPVDSGKTKEDCQQRFGETNIRPVTSGPMADQGMIEHLVEALGGPARSLSTVKAGSFQLQTGDPRFDPVRPVVVNGFLFIPATEA
jgi:hypothetical protein